MVVEGIDSSESAAAGATIRAGANISAPMVVDPTCLFCRIVAGTIPATVVRESADFVAFRDIAPQAPTHVLVVPKTHAFRDVGELAGGAPELAAALLAEGAEVARGEGLTNHQGVAGYRLVFNSGDAAGQTVYHVHLHVLGGEALGTFGSVPR